MACLSVCRRCEFVCGKLFVKARCNWGRQVSTGQKKFRRHVQDLGRPGKKPEDVIKRQQQLRTGSLNRLPILSGLPASA